MRILIVAPRFVSRTGQYYEFPLGLCYVSSCLKSAGFEVDCLNLNHTDEPADRAVARAMRTGDIGVVMSGGLSAHYPAVREIFAAARAVRPDVKAVAGGGIVSSEPELMLDALGLDYGVIGEGEITVVELARCLAEAGDPATVDGIVYRDAAGRVRRSKERALLPDLDLAPFPDYAGFGVETYLDLQRPGDNYYLYPFDRPRLLPVISSRSCPYNCTFCYHPLGKKYRRRSVDAFFAELDLYKDRYGVNMLAVLDELFPTESPWLEEFCGRMEERGLLWIAQLRVNNVTRQALRTLKRSGMFYISYGIESASPEILRSMRKHITVPEVESALALTREEKIGIQGNLLFGDPAETSATAAQSLDWWERHSSYHLAMNFVIPYPGSVLYAQCLERGLITDRLDFIAKGCPPPNMTALDAAGLEAVAARIAELKAGHRMFAEARAEDAGLDPVKGARISTLHATCPQCGEANTYGNVACEGLDPVKFSCRHCNQRFDLSPLVFPHLAARVRGVQAALRAAKEQGRPLAGAPALFRPTFEEFLGILGFGFSDFDWRCFLDERPHRQGVEYAPGVRVRPLDAAALSGMPAGLGVFVPPCSGWEGIVAGLESLGVSRGDILAADPA